MAVVAVSLLSVLLTGCIPARAGARCRTTDFGHDARNVLVCRDGRWRVLMTKQRAAEVLLSLAPTTTAAPVPPAAPPTPPPTAPPATLPDTVAPDGFFAARGVPGYVTVGGTFSDPDTPGVSVRVRVRIDGIVVRDLLADQPNVLPAGGGTFTRYDLLNIAIPVAAGRHAVCVEGLNTGPGPNLQRCSDLDVGTPLTVTSVSTDGVPGHVGCFVLGDTTVRCWGDNTYGAVGNGTSSNLVSPPAPVLRAEGGVLSGVTSVATGPFNTCAVLSDTTVRCWGSNEYGTVGDGTLTDRATATQVIVPDGSPLTGASSVTVGFHACAVLADTTVRCWGYNAFGGLGDGSTTVRTRAAAVVMAGGAALAGITQADAASGSTCARQTNGRAWCWGLDGSRHAYENIVTPRPVEDGPGQPLTGVAQMQTLGDGVWCARRSDGGVVCVLPFQMPAEGATPGPAPTPATRMDGDVPLGGAIDLVGRCIRRAGLPLRCWSESDGSVADYPPLPLGAGNVVTLGGDSYYGTCVLADTAMAWCGRDDGSFGPLGG